MARVAGANFVGRAILSQLPLVIQSIRYASVFAMFLFRPYLEGKISIDGECVFTLID